MAGRHQQAASRQNEKKEKKSLTMKTNKNGGEAARQNEGPTETKKNNKDI